MQLLSHSAILDREMEPTLSPSILVISADWRARALLTAQIGETTGRDVVSAPRVNEVLSLAKIAGLNPSLLVIDAGQDVACEDVERLLAAFPGIPLVLIASAFYRATFDLLGERCAAYLVRPVSIGEIADAVAQALASSTMIPIRDTT